MPISRRRWLQFAALAGMFPARAARARERPRFEANPFSLGMASGYPGPDGMVLWTRLAPAPSEPGGGLGPEPIPVHWEIAADEAMRDVVMRGDALAQAEWAHSVHVEVRGLAPDRWYWYRFTAGDAVSAVARTRTAPSADAMPAQLRFAFASCQQYEQGWYAAHRHLAADAPDLVAFLGDYIYESSWGNNHVRKHDAGEPHDLDDYRRRYALYKGDADLQAAHAACPWILIWDDHEVDNDYANDTAEDGMAAEDFLRRRAAAYRAWYEHQPLPASMRPGANGMRIHARQDWGRLARFYLLDCRQYRDRQVCPRLGRIGGSNVIDANACEALGDPARSLLGGAQETWLGSEFAASGARWNLIAQTTLMAQLDRAQPGAPKRVWTDGWDGYPAARRRLLEAIVAHRLTNPVVIGGDVHAHWVADLKSDFDDPAAPVIASEIVGTSITSQGTAQRNVDAWRTRNPHLKFGRSDRRGYVRAVLSPEALRVDLRAMDRIDTREAGCETLASFVIDDGRPGARAA